ncbi:MAG: aminotransferase class IV, partial [Gluconacetobacter diazotrophicus]|nr:aminotransferase class IV [Gluconacetobacter diazotrophicus]
MTRPTPTIWLNGRLLPAAEAAIPPDDRGLLLADGLFETIRLSGGGPAHPLAHLARLRAGAAVLGIPVPFPDPVLLDALASTAWSNALPDGSLRLTLTRGPGPRG